MNGIVGLVAGLCAGGASMGAVTNEYGISGQFLAAGFPPASYTIGFDVNPQAADLNPAAGIGLFEAAIGGVIVGVGATITGTGFVELNAGANRVGLIFDDAVVMVPGVGDFPFMETFQLPVALDGEVQPQQALQVIYDPPLETQTEVAPGLIATVTVEQFDFEPFCPGDIDDTLMTDMNDLNLLLMDFGCTTAIDGGEGEEEVCIGDLNGDGITDSTDLNELLAAFGQACPPGP